MKTVSTLHALETAVDVDTWKGRYTLQADDVVVALSAEAMDALKAAGIVHKTIEDFYAETDLTAAAANGNHIVKKICAALDACAEISFDQGLPEFSTLYYAGRLRVLRDNFLRAAFVLKALLDTTLPKYVISAQVAAPDTSEIWVTDPRFLSWVLFEICQHRKIAQHPFPTPPSPARRSQSIGMVFKNFLRFTRDTFLVLSPPQADLAYYYWPSYPETDLKQAGLRTVRFPRAWPVKVARQNIDTSGVWSFFEFDGLPLGKLAHPHLVTLLTEFRARHTACLRRYEKCLTRSKTKAVVASAALSIEAVVALLAARRADLPAIALQHGGFVGYCNWEMVPFIDLNLNDHYLVYGPGVTQFLETPVREEIVPRKHPVAFHETGSHNVSTIFKARCKPSSDKKTCVLYISTYLCGSSRYLAGHHRPDIAYLKAQRDVLRLLASHSDMWNIHYRPPPHHHFSPTETAIPHIDLGRMSVHTQGDLISLLKNTPFDLIITDAVTTVLLQAIATTARIITWFDKDIMRPNSEAMTLLQKRADVAFSEEEYLSNIRKALHEKRRSHETDDHFLMQYALSGTSSPATLQVQALGKIINTGDT